MASQLEGVWPCTPASRATGGKGNVQPHRTSQLFKCLKFLCGWTFPLPPVAVAAEVQGQTPSNWEAKFPCLSCFGFGKTGKSPVPLEPDPRRHHELRGGSTVPNQDPRRPTRIHDAIPGSTALKLAPRAPGTPGLPCFLGQVDCQLAAPRACEVNLPEENQQRICCPRRARHQECQGGRPCLGRSTANVLAL